jgi:hypothetical protein
MLAFAWPRIRQTLASRARGGSYYQIGTLARWAMGVSYLALGIVLLTLYVICELHMVPG